MSNKRELSETPEVELFGHLEGDSDMVTLIGSGDVERAELYVVGGHRALQRGRTYLFRIWKVYRQSGAEFSCEPLHFGGDAIGKRLWAALEPAPIAGSTEMAETESRKPTRLERMSLSVGDRVTLRNGRRGQIYGMGYTPEYPLKIILDDGDWVTVTTDGRHDVSVVNATHDVVSVDPPDGRTPL